MTVGELIEELDKYDAATLIIIETKESDEFADIELQSKIVIQKTFWPNLYESAMMGEYCVAIFPIMKKH